MALGWNWRVLLPRDCRGGGILVFTGLWERYELNSQRALLAQNVALVAQHSRPSVEALKNFDAIQRMSQPLAR